MQLEQTIDIAKSAEQIFAFLSHHPNHLKIVEQNLSCEQVTPGPMQVGTRVKNVARIFGPLGGRIEEHFEIVAFDPPRVLGKASREQSSFDTTDRFELTAIDGGTRVRFVVTASSPSVVKRALVVVMKPVLQGAMKKTLGKLKAIVEAQGPAGQP